MDGDEGAFGRGSYARRGGAGTVHQKQSGGEGLMAEKTYVGKGWTSKYGIRIALKKADIEKLPTNQYGDVLLEVLQRREPDEKSKATHYVIKDEYSYERAAQRSGGSDDGPF